MKLNKILTGLSLLLVLVFGVTACSSDDNGDLPGNNPDAIVISDFELGINHDDPTSNTGIVGQDFHTEANITAKFKLDRIEITLKGNNGIEDEKTITLAEGYKDAKGEILLHEHPVIPADFAAGSYTFTLTVYDQEGNEERIVVDDFQIKASEITASWKEIEVEYEGGNILHVEGELTVSDHLKAITIEVHKNDGDYKKEVDFDAEDFPHSHNDDGTLTYKIKEHVEIDGSLEGDYHIHVEFESKNGVEGEVFGGSFTVGDDHDHGHGDVSWKGIEVEYEGDNILHFEGDLTAPGHLSRITVEVHHNDGKYKNEFDLDLSEVKHTHNDDGTITYKIHEHLTIDGSIKGDYHIHVEYEGDDIPEDEVFGGEFEVK